MDIIIQNRMPIITDTNKRESWLRAAGPLLLLTGGLVFNSSRRIGTFCATTATPAAERLRSFKWVLAMPA